MNMQRHLQVAVAGSDLIRNNVDHVDTEDDIEFEIDETISENKNTKRKTETDMRIFCAYLTSLGETRRTEDIADVQLDRYLTMFFSLVKKHDGNDYEPASLRGMLCSIERFLRTRNYPHSITRDIMFLSTRNALKNRQRLLRETGKEIKTCVPESLGPGTMEKLNHLYNARELGAHSPMSVINSLCFDFVVHFRMRKAIDHKQLLWGDIVLKTMPDSAEYLCYQPAKNYDFCRPKLSGISDFKIWAKFGESPNRDTVSIYKLYARKRPSEMMAPESPFYLGVSTMSPLPNHPWYKAVPMGVNKLNDLVRMVRDITGLSHTIVTHTDSTTSDGMSALPLVSSVTPMEPRSSISYSPGRADVSGATASQNGRSLSTDCVSSPPRVEVASTDGNSQENEEMTLSEAKDNVRRLFTAITSESRDEFVRWIHSLEPGTGNSGAGNVQESSVGALSSIQLTFDLDHLERVTTEPRFITASLKRTISSTYPDPCCTRRDSNQTVSVNEWCAPGTPSQQSEYIATVHDSEAIAAPVDSKSLVHDDSGICTRIAEGRNETNMYSDKPGYKRSHSFPNIDSRDADENSNPIKYPRLADINHVPHASCREFATVNVVPPFPMLATQHFQPTNAAFTIGPDRGQLLSPLVPVTDPRYAVLLRNAEFMQNYPSRITGAPTSIEEAYLTSHDQHKISGSNPFSADAPDNQSPYVQFQLAHLRERSLHLSMLMARLAAEQAKPNIDDNKVNSDRMGDPENFKEV